MPVTLFKYVMVSLPMHPLFVHIPIAMSVLLPGYFLLIILNPGLFNNLGTRVMATAGQTASLVTSLISFWTGLEAREESLAMTETLDLHFASAGAMTLLILTMVIPMGLQLRFECWRHKKADIFLMSASFLGLILAFLVGHTGAEITHL